MEVRERRSPRMKQDMLSTVDKAYPKLIKDLDVDMEAEEYISQAKRPSTKASMVLNPSWEYSLKPAFPNDDDFDDDYEDDDDDDDEDDMAMMTTCCCCLSTKNGSIAIGVICLVLGFCVAVVSCFALINADPFELKLREFYDDYIKDVERNETVNAFVTIEKLVSVKAIIDNFQIVTIGGLIFYSLYTFSSLFMTYGACSDLRTLLLPWIVIEFVPFAIQLTGIVFVFIYGKDDPTLSPGGMYIIVGLLQIIGFVLHVYWWMCPIAHYQNLKESTEVEPLVPPSHPLYPNIQKY